MCFFFFFLDLEANAQVRNSIKIKLLTQMLGAIVTKQPVDEVYGPKK